MRNFIIVLLIVGTSNLSYAFDFRDYLKNPFEEEDQKNKSRKDQTTKKQKSKKSIFSDLAGLAKGTPVEEEVAIGEEIAGRLLGAEPLVDDDKLQEYVNKVGKWLAMQSDRKELEWHFGVLDTEDVNAFAAPGGFVFITRGLYKKLSNEAELAGVLGHEIGHITRKHHLKLIKKSKAIDMGGKLLRNQLEGDGGSMGNRAVQNLIGSGAEILARGLDKNAEYEADRIGVVLATRAGYDSYGLPAVLQEIGHISANDSSVSLLFKTHPHPNTRLAKLGEAMGNKFDKFSDGRLVSKRFYRIKD